MKKGLKLRLTLGNVVTSEGEGGKVVDGDKGDKVHVGGAEVCAKPPFRTKPFGTTQTRYTSTSSHHDQKAAQNRRGQGAGPNA